MVQTGILIKRNLCQPVLYLLMSRKMANKIFNDPIHGNIELEPLLVKIVDTPQFQRLRFIKQLGGAYFVYPGASHNRFEHSIGVCHLAGRLVRALKGQISNSEIKITKEDELCVKIAALCHDLGHGPFSHVFDEKIIPKILENEKVKTDKIWKHEQGSIDMFDHMLEENKDLEEEFNKDLSEKDKTFIKEMIGGPQKFEKDKNNMDVTEKTWPFEGRTKQKAFLYEIVSNKRNGVDVDKWDYFARDCHSLGIGNNFNLNRCIAFSRVIEVNGEQQICYRDKEVHNLYDMFHTRLLLHQRAYQHKTNNIIEYMLTEALVLANKSLKFQGKHGSVCMSETIYDMKAYTLLSDDVIYRILGSNDKKLQESKTILEKVLKRDLYSFVGEKRFPGGTFVEKMLPTYYASKDENADNTNLKDAEIGIRLGKVDDVKNDFQETLNGKPEFHEIIKSLDEFVVFDVVDFSYGKKDKDPIAYVNFYSKNEPNRAKPIDKDDVSLLLPTQFDEQVVRVYCKKENQKYKVEMMFHEWARETKKSAKKRKHESA